MILLTSIQDISALTKLWQEIRDPIHVFVRLDNDELRVLDSPPVQRLRDIHQLAMSYLVYPGATHMRFEHSLGTMELAGRVFDTVTKPPSGVDSTVQEMFPQINDERQLSYWRRVIRIATLCHDIGHLPFSHAAEHELLPAGWDHEQLTVEFIRSPGMMKIWDSMRLGPLRAEDIAKLAVGQKKFRDGKLDAWEAVLSEIVVGDAFGVDRMDYLLRDSHHAGVAYGRFDHFRLIDSLRILPNVESDEPTLGVEMGGLLSAEALLLARYFMFMQVYYHPARLAYDIHLRDFLAEWLPCARFPIDPQKLLSITDVDVMQAINQAARSPDSPLSELASRLVKRGHYRRVFERTPLDLDFHPDPGAAMQKSLEEKYGAELVRRSIISPKGSVTDFPVIGRDGQIMSAYSNSRTIRETPVAKADYVFVAPQIRAEAQKWIIDNKLSILEQAD